MSQTLLVEEVQCATVPETDAQKQPYKDARPAVLSLSVIIYDLLQRLLGCFTVWVLTSGKLLLNTLIDDESRRSTDDLLKSSLSLATRQEACRRRCLTIPIVPRPLLSSQTAQDRKLTVVLDLDETLVCAYHRKEVPEHLLECRADSFALTYDLGNGRLGEVVVFPRPGVRTFLQVLSGFCELVVFTAGHPGYARPVTDVLDPDGTLFAARLYRQATVRTAMQEYVKDLRRLGRCLSRTVLVDNDPFSGLLQPCNIVPMPPFHGDPSDKHLMHSLLPYLRRLAHAPDVRPALAKSFGMPEYFSRHGYCLYEDASGFLTAAATIISS